MTREKPSFETLWLQNIETMDQVQRLDRGNIRPVFSFLIISKEFSAVGLFVQTVWPYQSLSAEHAFQNIADVLVNLLLQREMYLSKSGIYQMLFEERGQRCGVVRFKIIGTERVQR
jgi:hypothetical protein